jgi:hypothetical protein
MFLQHPVLSESKKTQYSKNEEDVLEKQELVWRTSFTGILHVNYRI